MVNMKMNSGLCIVGLVIVLFFSNCTSLAKQGSNPASTHNRVFSLNNTLSIFMLNNENKSLFCIPIQYLFNDHIGSFSFSHGSIIIGDYEMPLKTDDITISVYLNENADENGSSASGFNAVYMQEKGKIILSKMNEPLPPKQADDTEKYNHYYIFIEKHLDDNDLANIHREYEKGNGDGRYEIWFDLVIDNEPQNGSGIMDDFELYDGIAIDPQLFPPNLNFFKAKYL